MNNIQYIDINCDVGEGVGNESALLPLVSSCSIACGGHAGDVDTMSEVVQLAVTHKVRIGAHPSYPDKENFGRVSMQISETNLTSSIQTQIEALLSILKKERAPLHHIKPHGALYNDLAKNERLVLIFLKAIQTYKSQVKLYVPYGSLYEKMAIAEGFTVKREAFADRNYNDDLSLVSRKRPNALITEPKAVLAHIIRMVQKNKVCTINNTEIMMKADTFCLHGDTPNALEILMYLRKNLTSPQVNIQILQ